MAVLPQLLLLLAVPEVFLGSLASLKCLQGVSSCIQS